MMKKRMLSVFTLSILVFIQTGCKNKQEENGNVGYVIKNDTVFVSSNHILQERIKTTPIRESMYTREIVTAGTIQPITTQYALIAPPFAGRISRSYVGLGDHVKEGTPLFEIISSDFISAQKEFFQAQSERELALKDHKRKEDLFKNGVASEKELEEAVNILKIAEKEYENAYAALRIYEVNPEQMVLGQPLIIRSPITGNVIENQIVNGLYLKDDAEPVAVVADLSKVWITAQVKEKDLRFIHDQSKMNIDLPAYPGEGLEGTVYHIDDSIDEETRSVQVLSICDNSDGKLKLGMYVTIRFTDLPTPHLTIPEKALLQDEKNTFVYVEQQADVYVKRPVDVEVTREGNAYILAGITKEDKVIAEGGYYLK